MTWTETYSGLRVELASPQVRDIEIVDIAHALSLQCRFNGNCVAHYSVAQHSVHVMEVIRDQYLTPGAEFFDDNNLLFAGLMHDAAEAYLGDLITPLKQMPGIGPAYKKIEYDFNAVIFARFGIAWSEDTDDIVSSVDQIMLATEARDLMSTEGRDWDLDPGYPPLDDLTIEPWPAEIAKKRFLESFQVLYPVELEG